MGNAVINHGECSKKNGNTALNYGNSNKGKASLRRMNIQRWAGKLQTIAQQMAK